MGAPSPGSYRSLIRFFGFEKLCCFIILNLAGILSLSRAALQLTKHARFARPNDRPRSDLANVHYFCVFWKRSVAAATPRITAARRRACFDVVRKTLPPSFFRSAGRPWPAKSLLLFYIDDLYRIKT